MSTEKTILTEGKTKIIRDNGDGTVIVESKDDITAGDGAKRDVLEGKAEASTQTTSNIFEYLNRHGVPTHFIERTGLRTFRAQKVEMIPLELVVRRILTGSYLKRDPIAKEGTVLAEPLFEIFEKDDAAHDPYLQVDTSHDVTIVRRFQADKSLQEGPAGDYPAELAVGWLRHYWSLRDVTLKVFKLLEDGLAQIDIEGEALVLVDFKIECGFTEDGHLVVADVIDNDSWRVWKGGQKSGQVDKQIFREIVGQMDPDQRKSLKKNFTDVAQATQAFATL